MSILTLHELEPQPTVPAKKLQICLINKLFFQKLTFEMMI
jgi:hypothetical protein